MTASQSTSTSDRQPLPRSREILSHLFEQAHQCVDFLDQLAHRETIRHDKLRSHLSSGVELSRQEQMLLRTLEDETVKQWAAGLPSIEDLSPYLPRSEMDELASEWRCVASSMQRRQKPQRVTEVVALLLDLACLLDVVRRHKCMISALKAEIVQAIEQSADNQADKAAKVLRVLPRNHAVLELYRRIEASADPFVTERDIAIQVAMEKGGKSESLLRGVRRLRKKLDCEEGGADNHN